MFRRALFNWEVAVHAAFVARITEVVPGAGANSIVWVGALNGVYRVKEICKAAELEIMGPPSWEVPAKIKRVVLPKVSLFVWEVVQGKQWRCCPTYRLVECSWRREWGVCCVVEGQKRWIIFFVIVAWQGLCGIVFWRGRA